MNYSRIGLGKYFFNKLVREIISKDRKISFERRKK